MKIELENFGIVKHFIYDTDDDFSIIFGKNNTGKSYAISAVYLIIKNFISMEEPFMFRYFVQDVDITEQLEKYNIELEKINSINIKTDVENIVSELISKVFLTEIETSFKSTFDSIENLQNQLTKKRLENKYFISLNKFYYYDTR